MFLHCWWYKLRGSGKGCLAVGLYIFPRGSPADSSQVGEYSWLLRTGSALHHLWASLQPAEQDRCCCTACGAFAAAPVTSIWQLVLQTLPGHLNAYGWASLHCLLLSAELLHGCIRT